MSLDNTSYSRSEVEEKGRPVKMNTCASLFLLLGTLFAGLAVAAGAFGAHFLKGILDPPMLTAFETAARYQMYHALGLCIVSWAIERYPHRRFATVGWLFTAGILLFSGSLYGLSLAGWRWLGLVTPLGGAAFIAGWALFAWNVWRSQSVER
jgi:uncharacterized membrane protein YgdD (TMEM256/DUF423 family)